MKKNDMIPNRGSIEISELSAKCYLSDIGPFGFWLSPRFAVFCLNFGAFGLGLSLRFTGFWHEITQRLLAEVQHFACRSSLYCHL